MQTYKYDTRISEEGVITLPFEPQLFNMEVEIIIVPKPQPVKKEKEYSALDFVRDWTGIFKNMTDEELDNAKYEYLMEKHK
ncbi:hypothetical protein [Candidatus Symbiothrix dinenymphae]|uniref:hypothetical protein n=1 Tax=Candidatus Symbiothrix dinenymphae TaxID=467085 RepID=UPI0006E25E4C|nr:hypothetical protein [Candidatus Symbiothrix dinenymphae]